MSIIQERTIENSLVSINPADEVANVNFVYGKYASKEEMAEESLAKWKRNESYGKIDHNAMYPPMHLDWHPLSDSKFAERVTATAQRILAEMTKKFNKETSE
ncbi:hypothetical protein PP940_gp141 [Rhizobium phage RL2RES]|uniref:Uncharacterized protein n=1 Tax=Rhizobium phage RL2RES TaxID=103371 RepID=A0A6B9JDH2_9CAUD|nr:hypothetical protein PP940_gp141 [Rhizobium phage RL2RES]QGZ14256.1 hypothetical protein RL2RES_141 [Rhizobium phage RL2RES]